MFELEIGKSLHLDFSPWLGGLQTVDDVRGATTSEKTAWRNPATGGAPKEYP